MHTRHAKGMCVSGSGRQEEGALRGEVRLAVDLNDSSSQRHSLHFLSSWSTILLRCEGSSSVSASTRAQSRPTKAIVLFYLPNPLHFPARHSPTLRIPFSSLFAVRCGGCAEAISPTELVMRAGAAVFHLRCFTCSVCSCRLQTGDRCVLRDRQLLCAREDYHQCLASPTSSDTGTSCLQCVCLCMCVCVSLLEMCLFYAFFNVHNCPFDILT